MKPLALLLILAAPPILAAPSGIFAENPASDRLIQFYQDHVLRDDTDFANYDRLGSAYLQKARETGDPVYYNLSEKAFHQALALTEGTPDSAGVTAHIAGLDLAEHRFAEARALAQQVVELKPDLLSVYAVLGDSGARIRRLRRCSARLHAPDSSGGLPVPASRHHIPCRYAAGRAELHTRKYSGRYSPDSRSHPRGVRSRAAQGKHRLEPVFSGRIVLRHGRFRARRGRLSFRARNLARLSPRAGLAPDNCAWRRDDSRKQPTFIAGPSRSFHCRSTQPRFGDIYTHMGQASDAQNQYGLVDVIARLSALNQNLFRRELALFYADHKIRLDESRALAEEELASRKDVYTWDVFAWTSFQNGKTAEAAEAIGHALAQGTEEPLFLFHAGMIFDQLGESTRARQYFGRALELNPNFHIVYADLARQMLQKTEVASVR